MNYRKVFVFPSNRHVTVISELVIEMFIIKKTIETFLLCSYSTTVSRTRFISKSCLIPFIDRLVSGSSQY